MSKISFEGIGEVAATFSCTEQVKAGAVVKVSGDCTVDACTAGNRFCGVAISAEDGCAAVQVGGFATVQVSGEGVSAGMVKLSADGQRRRKAGRGQRGRVSGGRRGQRRGDGRGAAVRKGGMDAWHIGLTI